MGTFLEKKYCLPKVTQEEKENPNSSALYIKEMNQSQNNFSTIETPNKLYKTVKNKLYYRNYYKGHMDQIKGEGEGGGGREGGSAGVGWRDGEKRHTTVIE